MPKHVLRKAVAPAPSPSHVIVTAHNRSVGILRGNIGNNPGPYKGQAMDKMPQDITVQQRIEMADAPTQLSEVARNLFDSSGETRYWTGVIGSLIDDSAGEIGFRQQLFQTVRQSNLPPLVGKTLLRRSVQLYKRRQSGV